MTVDKQQYQEKLLRQRREIVEQFLRRDSEWQRLLAERDSELEEEAQKLDISSIHERLENRETEELAAIELALNKMVLGGYGECENCGRAIREDRLEVLPAARLCLKCAQRFEQSEKLLPPPEEVAPRPRLPADFLHMDSGEIRQAVLEFLRHDGRINLEELQVRIEGNILYLEGTVPNESEHQILMRILKDELGFNAIADQLEITDLPWEREDRTPGTVPPSGDTGGGGLAESDQFSDDVFESRDEELPYIPPEGPPPEKE